MGKAKLMFFYGFLNFIGVLIAIFFLPQIGVFKFNSSFVVTQVVDKWYSIFIPTIELITCVIILLLEMSENGTRVHKYRYLMTFVASTIANCYTWCIICIQSKGYALGDKILMPWVLLFLFVIAGIMFASGYHQYSKETLSGKFYSFSWIMHSPLAWKLTHKVAGRINVLGGFILMVSAVLYECVIPNTAFIILITIIIVMLTYLVPLIYSRFIAKKYNN